MRVFFCFSLQKKISFSAIPFSPRSSLHSPQQVEEAMELIDWTTQQAAEGDLITAVQARKLSILTTKHLLRLPLMR